MTLWTFPCQPPLFMEFSRQEYWSMHRLMEQLIAWDSGSACFWRVDSAQLTSIQQNQPRWGLMSGSHGCDGAWSQVFNLRPPRWKGSTGKKTNRMEVESWTACQMAFQRWDSRGWREGKAIISAVYIQVSIMSQFLSSWGSFFSPKQRRRWDFIFLKGPF